MFYIILIRRILFLDYVSCRQLMLTQLFFQSIVIRRILLFCRRKMVLVNRTSKSLLLLALFLQYIIYLCSSNVSAQDYVDECPEPNGFYADAVQCDRYYECKDSVVRLYQTNLEIHFRFL